MNKLYYDRERFVDHPVYRFSRNRKVDKTIMISEVLDYWLTYGLYRYDTKTVINHLCDTFDILPITAKYILKLTKGLI